MGLGPLTATLRAGERQEPPGTGVTAPVGSVVFKKEKEARRWENKHSPPWPRKEGGKRPASRKQSALRAAARSPPVGIRLHNHFHRVSIQQDSLKAVTCRSPQTSQPEAMLPRPLTNI